jgi:8-oxo-dGTP diphosphatase
MKKVIQRIVVSGVVVNNGKILIVQRASNDTFPDLWEFPGGKREPLEKSVDGAKREVKEETGLDVEIDKVVGVFDYQLEKEDGIRDATQINFLVRPIGPTEVKLSEEHQNFAWITEKEIDNYKISDNTKEIIKKAFELFL